MLQRAQAPALAAALLAGTIGGVIGLSRVFDAGGEPAPAAEPVVGPTSSPSPGASSTPIADEECPAEDAGAGDLAPGYGPVGEPIEADLHGDGTQARVTILGDEGRPPGCRYLLVVEHPDEAGSYARITGASILPHDVPALLMAAEIDGGSGLEVVADFGGPLHPHRSGQIFTFDSGSLVGMRTEHPRLEGAAPILFALAGEFAAGIDCAGDRGAIVVTSGDLAAGGTDDGRLAITRTFYRAEGSVFVEFREQTHTLDAGTERERWPEIADDPFRSCSASG